VLSDRGGATDTLRLMAGLLEQAGEFTRARQALSRAIELMADDDFDRVVRLENRLSYLRLRDGDPEGAIALASQVVERTRHMAQPLPMAVAHANLGHIQDALGRFRAAEVSFQAAVALKRRHGFDNSLASTLNSLGGCTTISAGWTRPRRRWPKRFAWRTSTARP
jgi:tetratricopeptide (TPR) repeat protein